MLPLWTFFKRFLRYRRQLLAGFLCIPVANLADIGVTVLIGDAINRLQDSPDTEFLPGLMVLFTVFAVAHAVFRFLQRWWIVVVSRYFEVGLKQELFDKLTSLPFAFHNKARSGDIVSRLTSDVENLRMFLGPGLMYTAGAAVVVPVSLALLFTIDAPMAAAMVLPMLLMGLAMKFFSPSLHHHSVAVQESLADISHRAQENFSGIRIVKGYNREEQQARRFERTSRENMDNQILLARARGLTHAAVHGANNLTFVVILGMGGLALIDRRLVDGDLFKFIDLTFKVFWPLIALGWILGMYPRAVASAKRVTELMSEQSDILDPAVPRIPDPVTGRIELRDVGFTYEGADHAALSGIDVTVPAGSTLAVVGPTGAGKTTLLNLLGRLFEAEGEIRLDGVPLREIPLVELRRALGYVPQDGFLFSATYRENLAFGTDEPPTDAQLWEWIERACMREEVEAFAQGLEQLIGERGVTLSGGQRQRTCIARAIARAPRVLILDDCLSAVDTETESELLNNLHREGEGRTVIVAAHRLSTVREADQILVLDGEGRVESRGTHTELTARDGWYRNTWNRQQLREELAEL